MLFLLFVFKYLFWVPIQQESPFHILQFAVQVLGCGEKFFSSFEKSVNH